MLRLEGVSAGYGGAAVLRSIDVAVPDGSVVALLGPNGAGKTTLVRVASGLLAPTSGRVLFNGLAITGCATHVFASLGICHVPEGRGIFTALSVRDNLRLQASRHGQLDAIERASSVFPALAERLDQPAGTLSGGEQQMLALARAYLTEAEVVLLDEVSMGLAPRIVDEIFAFLRELAGTGVSLLLVEQYARRALELADYVYILDRGRVRFAGEPVELDADPSLLSAYLA